MDYTLSDILKNTPISAPSQIWVGDSLILAEQVTLFLQEKLCSYNTCSVCISCSYIRQRNHQSILWIRPEKGYVLEDLHLVFSLLSFVRDTTDPFYFIFEKAETLTPACTNALLKSIEEPPTGYHFIFCTYHLSSLLTTLQSRCHVVRHKTQENDNTINRELFDLFTQKEMPSLSYFCKMVESSALSEHSLKLLCIDLLNFWTKQYLAAHHNNVPQDCAHAQQAIRALSALLENPIMPGSAPLLAKNLFLDFFLK
jgi:DNA polymerase-3 subunit delta'